jgi:hypothetical protein
VAHPERQPRPSAQPGECKERSATPAGSRMHGIGTTSGCSPQAAQHLAFQLLKQCPGDLGPTQVTGLLLR